MFNKLKEILFREHSQAGKVVELQISGMSCQSCVRKIDKALKEVPTVKNVTISLENKLATIEISNQENIAQLVEAVTQLGYRVDKIVK